MKRSRLRPFNKERLDWLRKEQFGTRAKKIQWMRCVGCSGFPPCHSHHVRSRAAGGTKEDLVPLCPRCHNEVHSYGRRTWERMRGVNLRREADRIAKMLEFEDDAP
jgi:5-methylcytosine-specific restriction endonuclease McrA